MIDCNRCGVPLIEIVSEPDIRTPQEAAAYLKKLRSVIACTGASDCRMNEEPDGYKLAGSDLNQKRKDNYTYE